MIVRARVCNVCTYHFGQCTSFILHTFVYFLVKHACITPGSAKHRIIGASECLQRLFPFYTASTKLKWGVLVSPCSIARPSVRASICPSVDRIVFVLYLQQYSTDPFHIYTSYQAALEGVSRVEFWQIPIICNFDFVLFWLGIQYEPTVWISMGWWVWVSSERGRSSYSSCYRVMRTPPIISWRYIENINVM